MAKIEPLYRVGSLPMLHKIDSFLDFTKILGDIHETPIFSPYIGLHYICLVATAETRK